MRNQPVHHRMPSANSFLMLDGVWVSLDGRRFFIGLFAPENSDRPDGSSLTLVEFEEYVRSLKNIPINELVLHLGYDYCHPARKSFLFDAAIHAIAFARVLVNTSLANAPKKTIYFRKKQNHYTSWASEDRIVATIVSALMTPDTTTLQLFNYPGGMSETLSAIAIGCRSLKQVVILFPKLLKDTTRHPDYRTRYVGLGLCGDDVTQLVNLITVNQATLESFMMRHVIFGTIYSDRAAYIEWTSFRDALALCPSLRWVWIKRCVYRQTDGLLWVRRVEIPHADIVTIKMGKRLQRLRLRFCPDNDILKLPYGAWTKMLASSPLTTSDIHWLVTKYRDHRSRLLQSEGLDFSQIANKRKTTSDLNLISTSESTEIALQKRLHPHVDVLHNGTHITFRVATRSPTHPRTITLQGVVNFVKYHGCYEGIQIKPAHVDLSPNDYSFMLNASDEDFQKLVTVVRTASCKTTEIFFYEFSRHTAKSDIEDKRASVLIRQLPQSLNSLVIEAVTRHMPHTLLAIRTHLTNLQHLYLHGPPPEPTPSKPLVTTNTNFLVSLSRTIVRHSHTLKTLHVRVVPVDDPRGEFFIEELFDSLLNAASTLTLTDFIASFLHLYEGTWRVRRLTSDRIKLTRILQRTGELYYRDQALDSVTPKRWSQALLATLRDRDAVYYYLRNGASHIGTLLDRNPNPDG